MPAYTLTAVRSTAFTGTDNADVEPAITWLDAFPSTSGGYYAFISNALKLQFSAGDVNGLADLTGSYTNNQYVVGRLGNLSAAGFAARWIGAFLHCTGASGPGTAATYYRLRISQDSTESPLTTKIFRVVSGTATEIASTTGVTWANGDRFLFVDYDGDIEVYRDSGSGFGSTPVLTFDDTASRLTGGGPGLIIRVPDDFTLDDVEMGNAAFAASAFAAGATLGALVAGGSLSAPLSAFVAGATLGSLVGGGALSLVPGVLTVPELRNWSGTLLTSQLVENIVALRISDRALLAAFTNQTSHASTANLVVSQVGLVPGTACLVVGFNADGSAAFTRAVTIA